jgi:HEPN domain-containing protein
MKTDTMARDYLRRAKSRLIDSKSALKRGDYPEVIRYSQEATELSLKAVLRILGIEYPKVHDVSDILMLHKEKYPQWFQEEMAKLAEISMELTLKRAPAMYGLELSGKPASQLFDRSDSEEALKSALYVYEKAEKLISEFQKPD